MNTATQRKRKGADGEMGPAMVLTPKARHRYHSEVCLRSGELWFPDMHLTENSTLSNQRLHLQIGGVHVGVSTGRVAVARRPITVRGLRSINRRPAPIRVQFLLPILAMERQFTRVGNGTRATTQRPQNTCELRKRKRRLRNGSIPFRGTCGVSALFLCWALLWAVIPIT